MQLNSFTKRLSIAGRWIAVTLLFICTTAFAWHGAFLANNAAIAAPHGTLIAASLDKDANNAAEGTKRSNKSFVESVKEKVQDAAQSNSEKVQDALGDDNPVSRKASRDAKRIVNRSEEDASRTKKAIDTNVNKAKDAAD